MTSLIVCRMISLLSGNSRGPRSVVFTAREPRKVSVTEICHTHRPWQTENLKTLARAHLGNLENVYALGRFSQVRNLGTSIPGFPYQGIFPKFGSKVKVPGAHFGGRGHCELRNLPWFQGHLYWDINIGIALQASISPTSTHTTRHCRAGGNTLEFGSSLSTVNPRK